VTFLLSPVLPSTWKAIGSIFIGFVVLVTAFAIVTSLFSAGGGLLLFVIGFGLVALGIEAARLTARVERWRMSLVDDRPLIARPYKTLDPDPSAPIERRLRTWAEAEFLDSSRWLDVAYVLIAFPLIVFEFVAGVVLWSMAIAFTLSPVAYYATRGLPNVHWYTGVYVPDQVVTVLFVLGVILLPLAAVASRGLALAHRYVVEGMLCISPAEALRRDNDRLRGSRAATVELEATELRRIERDLHDGAQQRLVMLAIDLALAEGKMESDPAAAKTLVAGAREQARQALGEIRDVVRGTAPSILLDRGLVAALGAVAGRSAVPAYIDSTLDANERLPHAVERAAYYVVTEALTNVAKHASATRVDITLRREPHRLGVWIRDDGKGGASVVNGGGLAGLRDRVEALDGKLFVESPEGGPTMLHVELPLAAGSVTA
jgi:signal transduction histidine kinase